MTYTDFLSAFPEFSDSSVYSPAQFDLWYGLASSQLNRTRLGAAVELAAALFVAHNMILSARDQASAAAHQLAGDVKGPANSKGVGQANIGYAVDAVTNESAGYYNSTSYGIRYYRMLKAFSLGGAYRAPAQNGLVDGVI